MGNRVIIIVVREPAKIPPGRAGVIAVGRQIPLRVKTLRGGAKGGR